MTRYFWAIAAIAIVVAAIVGFLLLGPTAERPASADQSKVGR